MKEILGIIGILLLIVFLGITCTGAGIVCNYGHKAAEVVSEQIDPHELLRKYEWFKDASAALDAKMATIKVLKKRQTNLDKAYAGKSRSDWRRADAEQWNLWEDEVTGTIASYNNLAGDYNSQMSKINWRFCNVGQLPAGATEPLPREFKIYQEE